MVPNGTAYANYPPFANNGTKTPPGGSPESAKYALGMVPADTFPAEWANYLFHGATAGITRLNQDTGSIKKELNSILAAYNITNDASAFNQLLQVFNKLYPQTANCDTAAQTEVKAVAVQGDIQHAGTIYVIDMTNGNTYGDGSVSYPKISINSGTAYPICDANGKYVGSGAWAAGDTITVLFTGSKFLMATRAVTDSITQGDMAPATSNAVYRGLSWQTLVDEQYRGAFTIPDSANEVIIAILSSDKQKWIGNLYLARPMIKASITQVLIPCDDNERYIWDVSNDGKTFTHNNSSGNYNFSVFYR